VDFGADGPMGTKYGKFHKSKEIIAPVLKMVPLNSSNLALKFGDY